MTWLGKKLNFKEMNDWYHVSAADIREHGGSRLLNAYYEGSPPKAVMGLYPFAYILQIHILI